MHALPVGPESPTAAGAPSSAPEPDADADAAADASPAPDAERKKKKKKKRKSEQVWQSPASCRYPLVAVKFVDAGHLPCV